MEMNRMYESARKEAKHVCKMPPCPSYDIEGMESWLSDMAEKGMLLCKDGFFAGFAAFEKSEPCSMKYRLEAAPKNTSMWSEGGGAPDEEAVVISKKYGWEYVASRGQFYIYRSWEAGARELNTDPLVQALAINEVRKRERASVITCFFWLFIYPFIFLKGNLLLTMFHVSTGLVLYAILLMLWIFVGTLTRTVHLTKLRKKLLSGGDLDHDKVWKRRSVLYRTGSVVLILLIVVWLGLLLHDWNDSILEEGKISLADYAGDLPFASMKDFAPEGEYRMQKISYMNKVEQKTDWLAPTVISWQEAATIKLPDGRYLSGGLYVDYYETAAPWLAREAAREHLQKDRRGRSFRLLALPELGVDYAAACADSITIPTLIIQNGNKIIHATFYQTSDTYNLALEDWAQAMADSIK
jgi:hypothetical protein